MVFVLCPTTSHGIFVMTVLAGILPFLVDETQYSHCIQCGADISLSFEIIL